jgi:hypothetical protein
MLQRHGVLEADDEIERFFGYMDNERNWQAFATNHDIHRVNTVIEKILSILEADSHTYHSSN